MGRKELINIAAAGTLAIAEALTPKSAITQNSDIQPVEPPVLNTAIDCIKYAKPGKTIKLAQDYPGMEGQRRIILDYKGKRYTADVSKSYPEPFTRQHYGITFTYQSYLEIMERPIGTTEENKLSFYIDGNDRPSNSKIDYNYSYPNSPEEREAAQKLSEIYEARKLNGIVDDAQFPQDKSKEIIYSTSNLNVGELKYIENFKKNQKKYQEAYRKAVYEIAKGCKAN